MIIDPTFSVLVCSSKELYETRTSYKDRAEAVVIAYRDGNIYHIVKDRIGVFPNKVGVHRMRRTLELAEIHRKRMRELK